MVRTFLFCALAAAAGCSFGDDRPLGGGGDGGPDGNPDGMMDGPPVVDKDHLLISEIKSLGPAVGAGEFIEIWNPTTRTISLKNYYLADFADYWKLPSATPPLVATSSDFSVKFPDGASLGPKQVATIAFVAAEFQTRWGVVATYSIDATTGAQLLSDRRIGSGVPSLTNDGEPVVLYYWDGQSDLVKDVDIVFAGKVADSSTGNRLNTKTQVDGPDPDIANSSYKPDFGLGEGMATVSTDITSYKRRAFEIGNETQSGTGNGITGDDETSEILTSTWDGIPGTAPFTAPNPGTAPNF